MQTKKMIMIDTGLSTAPDFQVITPEDEDKTLSEIILEIAERHESSSEEGALLASQIRGVIQSSNHRMYAKGHEVVDSTKVKDLNFDLRSVEGEDVNVVEVNLQQQYTGGY